MSEVLNTKNNPIPNLSFQKQGEGNTKPDLNIQAHYSDNMKVSPPKVPALAPINLPNQNYIQQVNREADEQVKQINYDIFVGTQKERSHRAFNKVLYFKIFGGITLAAIIVACLRKFGK